MCNERISLHLPKSDTTCPLSPLSMGEKKKQAISFTRVSGGFPCFCDWNTYLDGLSGQWVDRPCRPDLELVQDHMSETLVVDNSDVNVRGELLASDPGVHWLVAIVVVPRGLELFTKVINRGIVFAEPETKRL